MSRTDKPVRRDVASYDRDTRRDRRWWQKQFRRQVAQALRAGQHEDAERRWRRNSGWLSH